MSGSSKAKLSGSTDGRAIKVVATASAGTSIHTAVASTVAGTWDEIWLWACNTSATAVLLTIQWGNTTAPDDSVPLTIPPQTGDVLVCAGKILQNGAVVRAFAATANVITISGYVNAITA